MRFAISVDGTRIDKTVTVDTPQNFEEGIAKIKETVEKLAGSAGTEFITVAGGIAGPIGKDKKGLTASPNLPDWAKKPLTDRIGKIFGASPLPVFLENDAVLAALGEATHGAGRGSNIVAYLTVSTGVGGARIVNGKIDEKTIGFEPGHQIIDADKTIIPEAKSEMFEDYISGTAVLRETGKKPKEVKDPDFWDKTAKLLAYGLNNTIVYWSPDVVVLGGSMITGDPAIPLDKTKKYLGEILKIYTELPELKKAELGDLAGLYGALEYLRQNIV